MSLNEQINSCERCSETFAPDWLTFVYQLPAGGHTLPSFSESPAKIEPPRSQRVCFSCLTDDELLHWPELRPLFIWFLTATVKQMSRDEPQSPHLHEMIVALETLKTMHVILNLSPVSDYRGAVSNVLRGLSKIEEEKEL